MGGSVGSLVTPAPATGTTAHPTLPVTEHPHLAPKCSAITTVESTSPRRPADTTLPWDSTRSGPRTGPPTSGRASTTPPRSLPCAGAPRRARASAPMSEVEARGRFVEEERAEPPAPAPARSRRAGTRPRANQPAIRRRTKVQPVELGAHRGDVLPALGAEDAEVWRTPQPHVLPDRDPVRDHRLLRDECHLPSPLASPERSEPPSQLSSLPRTGISPASVQQRGLARAVGADDADPYEPSGTSSETSTGIGRPPRRTPVRPAADAFGGGAHAVRLPAPAEHEHEERRPQERGDDPVEDLPRRGAAGAGDDVDEDREQAPNRTESGTTCRYELPASSRTECGTMIPEPVNPRLTTAAAVASDAAHHHEPEPSDVQAQALGLELAHLDHVEQAADEPEGHGRDRDRGSTIDVVPSRGPEPPPGSRSRPGAASPMLLLDRRSGPP